MQYVRSLGGSVSKTWNSINPATLSGAIDVIVVELEDGKDLSIMSCIPRSNVARLARLFPIPCTLWKVFVASPIRKEGKSYPFTTCALTDLL